MSGKRKGNVIVIGISGVTCGGKTTIAQKLSARLPNSKIISQDDYFLGVEDPRHTWIPELNHINWEILSSLDMEKMHKNISSIINDGNFERMNGNLEKIDNKLSDLNLQKDNPKVLIVEGFSIFNYEGLVPLCDLKYYLTLTKEDCLKRRSVRVYDPPDVPGYFEKCVWPEHLSHFEQINSKVEHVNFFSGTMDSDDITQIIIKDIFSLCGEI